jgi:hypothetical protein
LFDQPGLASFKELIAQKVAVDEDVVAFNEPTAGEEASGVNFDDGDVDFLGSPARYLLVDVAYDGSDGCLPIV